MACTPCTIRLQRWSCGGQPWFSSAICSFSHEIDLVGRFWHVGALAWPVTANPPVTTDWLERNIDDPKLRIVEVSVEPGLFERGHLPNAHNVAWHTDLVDTVSREIASPEKFQALARRLGVDKDTTVGLYGDNNNWFSA